MPTMIDPRYPIGKYEAQPFSIEKKVEWLADIKFLPLALENAILNLDEEQLQTPYREGNVEFIAPFGIFRVSDKRLWYDFEKPVHLFVRHDGGDHPHRAFNPREWV